MRENLAAIFRRTSVLKNGEDLRWNSKYRR